MEINDKENIKGSGNLTNNKKDIKGSGNLTNDKKDIINAESLNDEETVFCVQDLSFSYPTIGNSGAQKKAIDEVSFSVKRGEFVIIAGESGCGKTTLLRLLKPELAPHGEIHGSISFVGNTICGVKSCADGDSHVKEKCVAQNKNIDNIKINNENSVTKNADIKNCSRKYSAGDIGFVMQNPESQIVQDKVWRELSFGLENMGLQPNEIHRRIAEVASYFGLEKFFRGDTATLSGGEKQLLNLASILAMQPTVLLLDEPTSQLDPLSAAEFVATLRRVNKLLGISVVIVEHRLEEIFALADKVLIMEKGKIIANGTPREVGQALGGGRENSAIGLPCHIQVFNAFKNNLEMSDATQDCPMSAQEGREFLKRVVSRKAILPCNNSQENNHHETNSNEGKLCAIHVKNAWVRYEKKSNDILRGVDLNVSVGDIFCLVGGNGTGKSTLLKLIARQIKCYDGGLKLFSKNIYSYKDSELYRGNIALLPQNPIEMFVKDSVLGDLMQTCAMLGYDNGEKYIDTCLSVMGVLHLKNSNPFDVSGGEIQRLAFAKLLLLQPRIMLLDEPTKGLDNAAKLAIATVIKTLQKEKNMTFVIVSHDLDFCAEVASSAAMMFDGEVVGCDSAQEFFGGNSYYTTAACIMSKGIIGNCITAKDIICSITGDEHGKSLL